MYIINHYTVHYPNVGGVVDAEKWVVCSVLTSGSEETSKPGCGDWAVYVALVPESLQDNILVLENVAHRGQKLSFYKALTYFPNMSEEDYRP